MFRGANRPTRRRHRRRFENTPTPPPPPVEQPADTLVGSLSAINAAYTAAPSNLGRDYIIDVLPGTYGYLTVPSGYNKGTTRVVLRGASGGRPAIAGIDARSTTNLGFRRFNLVGTVMDEFGFPNGSPTSNRGLRITDATNIQLLGLRVEQMAFGIEANNINGLEVGYCTLRANAVDSLRLYAIGSPNIIRNVWVHHNLFDIAGTTDAYPDLTTRGLHYALPRNVAPDPRRSDQYGYNNADSEVLNLAGSYVTVTEATKSGRHPDLIQGAGPWQNVVIEDNQLTTNNLYCHGIYIDNLDDGGWATSTGVVIRRNLITSAHPHALAFQGAFENATRVEQCIIRPYPTRTWALNVPGRANNPGLMRPGISTNNSSGLITVVNTVLPAQVPSPWTNFSKMIATNVVQSDTAVPTGWASTDVALGRIGHAYAA